jgi:3,4-dihydroxy 2-butanone 4-phosphate synthase
MKNYTEALKALRDGNFVLLYDRKGREEETDIVLAAEHVTPQRICEVRHNAGGLICVAIRLDIAQRLGLPFMTDILESVAEKNPVLSKLASIEPFGDKPAFSITVNHRKTYTGITDKDRALTIRELARIVQKAWHVNPGSVDVLREEFVANFRSPGHIHILIAAKNLFLERRGHTELSVALAEMAGVAPATMICEMLDSQTGRSLSKEKATHYARQYSLPFIEGEEIVKSYSKFKEERGHVQV